jgi:hypothetical protein
MKSFKQYINEDIRSKLKKLKNLSTKEKSDLEKFFKRNAHLESDPTINWNDKNLVFADFDELMSRRSFRKLKKRVKKKGLYGMIEGKDYIDVSYMCEYYNLYIPLNFDASRMFGTKYIGKCIGKWCTSHSYKPAHWNFYQKNNLVIPIAISPDGYSKYGIAVHAQIPEIEIFDKDGDQVRRTPKESLEDVINRNKTEILSYQPKVKKYKYKNTDWIYDAETEDADFSISGDEIIWHDGVWISGVWKKGVFEHGAWLDGTWREGDFKGELWKRGTFEAGRFYGDVWQDGTFESHEFHGKVWENGTFNNGVFWEGEWLDGEFNDGAWVDGEWLGGKWNGGLDRYKREHKEDDSPDMW